MNNSLAESNYSLKGKEILLLEDDTFLVKRLIAQLESADAEVTSCTCLEEAKQALQSLSFDFALMDLNLPDGESLELLRDEKIPLQIFLLSILSRLAVHCAAQRHVASGH